jgi:aminoglycoside phosphotransferase
VDEEIETVFWLFPADRKLRSTGWLDAVPAGLRDAFGEPWVASVVAAYAPERAVTARCLAASGAVLGYAKAFHADLPKDAGPDADPGAADGLRSQAILTAARDGLPAGSPLRLATPLGYRDGVSLYSALPGVPLSTVPLRPPVLAALGRALAALHARPVGALAEDGSGGHGGTGTRLNPGRIRRAAELVGQALPEHAEAAARVADLLLADLPAPAPRVHLHGDVHPANVLVQPEGIALVDLDQATAGPAAADLGPLLARLRHPAGAGPAGPPDPATRALSAAALLDGYGHDRPGDGELTWYGAAALLVERALRAVNCVRPEGLAELPNLLAAATTWLEER